jgi:hypothetical protein
MAYGSHDLYQRNLGSRDKNVFVINRNSSTSLNVGKSNVSFISLTASS